MVEIYLLRHAQTIWGETILSGSITTVPLSEEGVHRAKALGELLKQKDFHVDQIYCSTALRTRQTLDEVRASGVWDKTPVDYSNQLLEVSLGDWEGCPRSAVITKEIQSQMDEKGPLYLPPNGESQQAASDRIMGFITKEIIAKCTDGKFLIVGHANLFSCLIYKILDFRPNMINKLGFSNLSLTKLRYDKDRLWRMDYINHCLI